MNLSKQRYMQLKKEVKYLAIECRFQKYVVRALNGEQGHDRAVEKYHSLKHMLNLKLELRTLMKALRREMTSGMDVYIDGTDWDHHMGCDVDGVTMYWSEKHIKRGKKCVDECGIVKARIKKLEKVQASRWEKRRG